MKKLLNFLCISLCFLAFCDVTPEQLASQLSSVESNITVAEIELASISQYNSQILNEIANGLGYTPGDTSSYGDVEAMKRYLYQIKTRANDISSYIESLTPRLSSIKSSVANVRGQLSALSSSSTDYSTVLASIENTISIISSQLSSLISTIELLKSDVSALKSFFDNTVKPFLEKTEEFFEDVADYNEEIKDFLEDWCRSSTGVLYRLSSSLDSYSSFVTNRISKPDLQICSDIASSISSLRSFFSPALSVITGYVDVVAFDSEDLGYTKFLSDALQSVQSGDMALSTEGLILTYLWGQGERDYYRALDLQRLLEIIRDEISALGVSSNSVDLSSITNYLYSVQNPLLDSSTNLLSQSLSTFIALTNRISHAVVDSFKSLYSTDDVGSSLSILQCFWRDTLSPSNGFKRVSDFAFNDSMSYASIMHNFLTDLRGGEIELSNEGLLLSYLWGQGERDYYRNLNQQKIFEGMHDYLYHMTNSPSVDLSWITNYLATVQRGFFDGYNGASSKVLSAVPNPFNRTNYALMTNLLSASTMAQRDTRYNSFSKVQTNLYTRIELQLMALNGLFPTANEFGLPDDLSTSDDIDHKFTYLTNSFSSANTALTNMTHSIADIKSAFTDFVSSFDIPEGSFSGTWYILPEFSVLPGLTMPALFLPLNDIQPVLSSSHTIFSVVWHILFLVIGWRLVTTFFYRAGRVIAHISVIVSTLLSK